MSLTPEDQKALATWKSPRGLMINDHNINIMIDAITKKFGGKYTHENLGKAAFTEPGLLYETGFSPAEQTAVWNAWWAQAPKNLLREQANAGPLIEYVERMCGGVWSIPSFNSAYEAVKAQLKHTPVKSLEEIAREREAADLTRRQQEKLENSKTFDPGAKAKQQRDESTKKQEAKAQEEAQRRINELAANFTVNAGPGRTDWEQTNSCRTLINGTKINLNGKFDAVFTEKVLRRAIFANLQDNPTVRSLTSEIEKAKDDLIDAMKSKSDGGGIR